MLLHAASAEACPPPHYRHCAPLIPYQIWIHGYLITDKSLCQRLYKVRTGKRQADQRRLPATFRTTPPMNFGSRMHTILTRMLSPPASSDQRPSRADERRACHGCPRPSRDAQKQQQQPNRDKRTAQQLPQPILLRTAAHLPHRLIPDLAHGFPPRFTARICPHRLMHTFPSTSTSKKLGKDDIFVTFSSLQEDRNRVK